MSANVIGGVAVFLSLGFLAGAGALMVVGSTTLGISVAVGGTWYVGTQAVADVLGGRVSSSDAYLRKALAGSAVGFFSGVSSLAMAGVGLGQTMGIAFAEGAFGSAASQQILDGEIDWKRVVVDGTFSSIMEGVLWGVRNPGGVTEGVGELPDIQIGRSVGAKAKNYEIVTPNGETLTLTEGSRITDVQTIAGAGRNRQIDIVDVLVDNYGGDPLQWKKCKGYGYVDIDGESLLAELHWYEEPTIGKVATCAIAFITLELQALEDVKN